MARHRISLGVVAGVLVATVAAPLIASAISDEQACTDSGGVYSNDHGTKTCTYTTTPGNNQGGVTKTEEDSQKGSFSSSHPLTEEDCVNNNGGNHC